MDEMSYLPEPYPLVNLFVSVELAMFDPEEVALRNFTITASLVEHIRLGCTWVYLAVCSWDRKEKSTSKARYAYQEMGLDGAATSFWDLPTERPIRVQNSQASFLAEGQLGALPFFCGLKATRATNKWLVVANEQCQQCAFCVGLSHTGALLMNDLMFGADYGLQAPAKNSYTSYPEIWIVLWATEPSSPVWIQCRTPNGCRDFKRSMFVHIVVVQRKVKGCGQYLKAVWDFWWLWHYEFPMATCSSLL